MHHPDEWMKNENVVYHASYEDKMPRRDRGPNHLVDYGGSEGMHFGTKMSAYERATQGVRRDYIHTARLNGEQFTPKDFGVNDSAWTDDEANYGPRADKAVSEGKIVPYRNDYEGKGEVSYRAHRSAVRTWSEDVRDQPNAHPALKHLAKHGYNPTLEPHKMVDYVRLYHEQTSGPSAPHLWEAELVTKGKTRAVGTEDEMFAKMKTAPVGSGVVRLNQQQSNVGWAEKVKQSNPRMVRPKDKEKY